MPRTRKRILFVDDDQEICAAITLLLEYCGYDVTPVRTQDEALRLAEVGNFDLLMLDQKFPDGSGLELCRRIRLFDPETPILFYSAIGRQVDVQLAIAAGAQDYLKKPTSLDVLDLTISHLISESKRACQKSSRLDMGKELLGLFP